MPKRSKNALFSRLFLVAIGVVSLVILVLSTVSLFHEAELSSESLEMQGERLAIDIERMTWDLANACLENPDLRSLAYNVPKDPVEAVSFGAKVEDVLKRHPIADSLFITLDGNLLYPRLEDKPHSPVDELTGGYSPYELEFVARFREAEDHAINQLCETSIPIFKRCSEMQVSNNLKAQALERLALCYADIGNPTNAVRTWHRLEENFGDCLSESRTPYALLAPVEIDRLVGEQARSIPDNFEQLYRDLINGRWQLGVNTALAVKARLESRMGASAPKNLDSAYLRQLRNASAVEEKLKSDTVAGPFKIYTGNIFEEQQGGTTIFYSVFPEKSHRRILAISVRPDWITGPLLQTCRQNLNTEANFVVKPKSSLSDQEMVIPFRTVFPHLELRLPEASIAAILLASKVQFWTVAGSGVMMLALIGMIIVFLARLSREQAMIQTRSNFLGHISHELKTPLTLILLYTETMSTDENLSEEERRNCLNVISREGERLKHLIENLLQISKIERAKADYRMEEGDIGSVIEKTARVCADWLRQLDIEVKVEIAPDLPPAIFDRERVAQAVVNLIENARKYGESKPVDIRLWSEGSSVIFEVEDRGIGIPESEKSKIFDQYYRASNAASQRGSGLGLFLVNETMKAHKGEVEVVSEAGKGSRFRLIFPATEISTNFIPLQKSNQA